MISALLRAATLLTIATSPAPTHRAPAVAAAPLDTIVVAGGCFWGVQAVFQHVTGVVSATSGYAGGKGRAEGYEQVSSGTTGHAEVVRVVFDPSRVAFGKLMQVFFDVAHDPTQLNFQGPDHGTQYRSALFFTKESQRVEAQAYIAQLMKSGYVKKPIVTEIAPLKGFYEAEAYHQDYATLNPDQPYIRINDAPKVADLKKRYSTLWTDKLASH